LDIIKIYNSFQEEFIKKIEILPKGVFFILVGQSLLKDMEDKPVIVPVLSDTKNIADLKIIINKIIEKSGKDIQIKCFMSFDVKENELITSLEYLGEDVSNQEKISVSINREKIVDKSYQIF
jgi:hypothetical protein